MAIGLYSTRSSTTCSTNPTILCWMLVVLSAVIVFLGRCLALTGQAVFEEGSGCQVDGTLVVAVEKSGVSSMAQQQGTHLHTVLGCCLMQRCELPKICCVNTGTMLKVEHIGGNESTDRNINLNTMNVI